MSEGINFSDELARCVVVVGLPFPNPRDPELRERMAYLDRKQTEQMLAQRQAAEKRKAISSSSSSTVASNTASNAASFAAPLTAGPPSLPPASSAATSGSGVAAPSAISVPPPTAGREYYENMCMKAVNQSIGRSIRHARDYSTIVLLDERFSQSRIRGKLPAWISKRLTAQPDWGPVAGGLGSFFRSKKQQQQQQ